MHYDFWMDRCTGYDLTLDGRQTLEYWVLPAGSFDAPKLAGAIDDIAYPLIPVQGYLQKAILPTIPANLRCTSLYVKDDKCHIRGYQLPGENRKCFHDFEIFDMDLDQMMTRLYQET